MYTRIVCIIINFEYVKSLVAGIATLWERVQLNFMRIFVNWREEQQLDGNKKLGGKRQQTEAQPTKIAL